MDQILFTNIKRLKTWLSDYTICKFFHSLKNYMYILTIPRIPEILFLIYNDQLKKYDQDIWANHKITIQLWLPKLHSLYLFSLQNSRYLQFLGLAKQFHDGFKSGSLLVAVMSTRFGVFSPCQFSPITLLLSYNGRH